jgi:hypothetical protein
VSRAGVTGEALLVQLSLLSFVCPKERSKEKAAKSIPIAIGTASGVQQEEFHTVSHDVQQKMFE